MPELPDRPTSTEASVDRARQSHPEYRIIRKGSRYNITGPDGRIFSKYKSASTAGPRWEELTHTPWPHQSSAYESGLRLWELGIITRDEVGQTTLSEVQPPTPPPPEPPPTQPVQEKATVKAQRAPAPRPAPEPETPSRNMPATTRANTAAPTLPIRDAPLALPAPKIDLARQQYLIAALRKNPRLLFNATVQEALRHEVAYHLPYAKWAQKLLTLLARYEARQRSQAPSPPAQQNAIMVRHIAWQEQRLREVAAAR